MEGMFRLRVFCLQCSQLEKMHYFHKSYIQCPSPYGTQLLKDYNYIDTYTHVSLYIYYIYVSYIPICFIYISRQSPTYNGLTMFDFIW